MLERVISGGQTGADRAGWRAARAAGIATAGWMPRGFLAEDGPHPEFAACFGASEQTSADPADRTIANVREADGTLVFVGARPGAGTMLTIETGRSSGVPHRVVDLRRPSDDDSPRRVACWIVETGLRTLNVAGDRESQAAGRGAEVESFLAEVFRCLREEARLSPPGPVPTIEGSRTHRQSTRGGPDGGAGPDRAPPADPLVDDPTWSEAPR